MTSTAMVSRISKLFGIFLGMGVALCLLSSTAHGHTVKQLFLSLEKSGTSWELKSTFDAAYALPEFRNDANTPQPKRAWLLTLNQSEHSRLQKEAETYLRESLLITHAGAALDFQVSFPDYETTPPTFPSMLNGGAYFTILIKGSIAPSTAGDFKIKVQSGDRPDFVIGSGPKENRHYHVIPPESECTLFSTTASGTEIENQNSGLFSILKMGFTHVIPYGLDHLLFILALFLMARKWGPLLSQSLTFTLAHSITLGLAASGLLNIGQWSAAWLIEPLIALSIAVVALENLFIKKSSPHRLIIVFLFGLVHGLGFAGSLATSLEQGSSNGLIALAMANLGVELAQITILALAWIVTLVWWREPIYQKLRKSTSLLIAVIGIFWMIERLMALS